MAKPSKGATTTTRKKKPGPKKPGPARSKGAQALLKYRKKKRSNK